MLEIKNRFHANNKRRVCTTPAMSSANITSSWRVFLAKHDHHPLKQPGDLGKTLKGLKPRKPSLQRLSAGVLDKLGTTNSMGEIKDKLANGTGGLSE